jgi:hypothetical protein
MPLESTHREILPLILKKISVNKIKNLEKNIYHTREYLASKTENNIASKIYEDTYGYLKVEPLDGFYAPIDFILSNPDLGIKNYIELKSRNGEDKYESLMIGKTKVITIIVEELFPTYVINTWGDNFYIYAISDESFFRKYKHTADDRNLYIPKTDCFNYSEFKNRMLGEISMRHRFSSLNCDTIIP